VAGSSSLSVDAAWNSVALEERLELVSKCQADGLIAALGFTLMMGSAAYGFDKIYILLGSILGAMIIMPMFSSYSWRRGKPALILSYLAARSMARRYAYGANIVDFDVVLIFKGEMTQKSVNEDEELDQLVGKGVDLDNIDTKAIPVWICLMRGGVVLMSEKLGGARLEFCTPIGQDLVCQPTQDGDGNPTGALTINGISSARGRSVTVSSRFPAAFYVFERQLNRLIEEAPDTRALNGY
jgi:hypothetical protein